MDTTNINKCDNNYNYNLLVVEGEADKRFLEEYLKFLGKKIVGYEDEVGQDIANDCYTILSSFGRENIKNLTMQISKHNEANKDTSLRCAIIFDADLDNDYDKTKKFIDNHLSSNNLKADIFLFPNNKSVGDLETLLEQIINSEKQCILDCFEGYEQCLQNQDVTTFTPARKSKIYSYLEVQLDSKSKRDEAKEVNRNYRDSNFWHLESHSLDNLKAFLTE